MERTILILAILCGGQSLYGQPFIYGVNGYEGLVLLNVANGDRTVLTSDAWPVWPTSVAFSPSTSELILADDAIFRTDLNFSRTDTILTSASFGQLYSIHGSATSCDHHAITVDPTDEKTYVMGHGWCGSHFISMNLDGSDLKWIGLGGDNLAIHPVSRRAYFSAWGGVVNFIISKELDDSDPEILVREDDVTGGGRDEIGGAVFDFGAGSMYWQNQGEIKRANLDGSDEHPIAEAFTYLWSGMLLDAENGHIYYSVPDPDSLLWRINLDGSGKTAVSRGGFRDMVILPSTTTSLSPSQDVPYTPTLLQNHPNPFLSTTQISYQLPVRDRVKLTVRDMLGREITVLERAIKSAGRHRLTFSAGRLPNGVYVYRLETSSSVAQGKMLLVR
jgi:hypothetical protein